MRVFVLRKSSAAVPAGGSVVSLKPQYIGGVRNEIVRIKGFRTDSEARDAIGSILKQRECPKQQEIDVDVLGTLDLGDLDVHEVDVREFARDIRAQQVGVDICAMNESGEIVLKSSVTIANPDPGVVASRIRLEADYRR